MTAETKIYRKLYGPEFYEGWGEGRWRAEPDQVLWQEGRYWCEIKRHSMLGHLCGYVSIDRSHPAWERRKEAKDFDVHGGITCAKRRANRWKIGFDCAHYRDLVPSINLMRQPGMLLGNIPGIGILDRNETYRDVAFVEAEIHSLIEQFECMRHNKKKGG